MYRTTLSEEDPDVALVFHNIGDICAQKNEEEKAFEHYTAAHDIRQRVLGKYSILIMNTMSLLQLTSILEFIFSIIVKSPACLLVQDTIHLRVKHSKAQRNGHFTKIRTNSCVIIWYENIINSYYLILIALRLNFYLYLCTCLLLLLYNFLSI